MLRADWCSVAFDNGDGLVADEGLMAVENDGWLKLSTAVEIGGW